MISSFISQLYHNHHILIISDWWFGTFFIFPFSWEESSQLTTLWLFNIAMENGPFIDDFPIKPSIYQGFSMAMLNNQMVIFFRGVETTNQISFIYIPMITARLNSCRISRSLKDLPLARHRHHAQLGPLCLDEDASVKAYFALMWYVFLMWYIYIYNYLIDGMILYDVSLLHPITNRIYAFLLPWYYRHFGWRWCDVIGNPQGPSDPVRSTGCDHNGYGLWS